MRKATEPIDDIAVLLGVTQPIIVPKRGEQQQRPILIPNVLAVLERHEEETAFCRLELVVEAFVYRDLGDCEREMIGRELVCIPCEHVARELVEQDHRRKRRQRVANERVDL